ncbi:alpha/beta hydrolase [Streptomyces sp. NPDC051554]|uniref:alpha/beta hydrolase n=1 Tax=Streptomyces sp. NPDC051554 TaxID=3365656 RepID=UPI00379A3A67
MTTISPTARIGACLLQASFGLLSSVPKAVTALAPDTGEPTVVKVPTHYGDVRCLVYRPQAPSPDAAPALPPIYVHFHGGAFIVRRPEQDHHVCRYITATTGAVVINVDYSTAPSVQYPVAEHQAYDVTAWAVKHGAQYGWDSSRLAVGGLSAGAKLAINVCQQARDTGLFMPAALVSAYGATDMTLTPEQRSSPKKHPAVAPWLIRIMYAAYFAHPARRAQTLASPVRDEDVASFPPTLIMTGGLDTMAAESDQLAEHLTNAGVTVTHQQFPSADHGFAHNKPVATAHQSLDLIARHLNRAFTTGDLRQRFTAPD